MNKNSRTPGAFSSAFQAVFSYKKTWMWLFAIFASYSLLLGLAAPWLLKSQLQKLVLERTQLELHIDKLRINPYRLSLNLEGLKLSGAELDEPLGFKQLYVNFQLSSIYRWAWSFDQVHLLGIYGKLERLKDRTTNLSAALERWQTSAPDLLEEDALPEPDVESKPVRLWIEDLQITLDRVALEDRVPTTTFQTHLGPITLTAHQLTSIPNESGHQFFELHTPEGLAIQWNGSIGLQPLTSEGTFQLTGPLLHLAAVYLQDQLNFTLPEDQFKLSFNYQLNRAAAQAVNLKLRDINVELTQLAMLESGSQKPLLRLKQASIKNAQFDWPEQQVQLPQISLDSGEVWLTRTKNGAINWTQLLRGPDATPQPSIQASTQTPAHPPTQPSAQAATNDQRWQLSNKAFTLKQWKLHFRDQSLPKPAQIDLNNLNIKLNGFTSATHAKVSYTSSVNLGKGKLTSTGTLQLFPLSNLQLDLQTVDLPLAPAQAYLEQQARVELKSGTLDVSLQAQGDSPMQLHATGNLEVKNLAIHEQSNQRKILGWSALKLSDINANQADKSVSLANIEIDKAFADFAIARDGTTNIERILVKPAAPVAAAPIKPVTPTTASSGTEPSSSINPSSPGESGAEAFSFKLGKINFTDASGRFSDDSLPLPFKADMANMNGYISAIESDAQKPAKIKLKGQVGEFGQVQISGQLLPLLPKEASKIQLQFRNLEIPNFTPYSIKFAGRKIASGKMDLDLNYAIKQGAMDGKNNLVLRDFKLGQRVEQPGALDLPLDLAIALLKDGEGNIRADLPVSGQIDDPQFDYGKVIGQAFVGLIGNIASAPFKLLANLVGVSNSKGFGKIYWQPGSSELTPPEREKLVKLAEAIVKRPDLHLEIAGVFHRELDRQALALSKLTQQLQAKLGDPNLDIDLTDPKHLKKLEELYGEYQLTPSLTELRKADETANGDNADSNFNYAGNLEAQLLAAMPISDEDLLTLANARAQHIANFLQADQGLNSKRFSIQAPVELKKTSKGRLTLALKLSVTN